MTPRTVAKAKQQESGNNFGSGDFFNAFDIAKANAFQWRVRLYSVRPIGTRTASHEDRGAIKSVIWKLRRSHQAQCSGYGFVVDVDATTVAIPETWRIAADGIVVDEFVVTFKESATVSPANPGGRKIVEGILREGLKKHFKENVSDELGSFWQDYNSFCQLPDYTEEGEAGFCRRFNASAKVLKGNRWVIQLIVNTVTVDRSSFADYYRRGDVRQLAEYIEAKRANRIKRDNRPVGVRVLRDQVLNGESQVEAIELAVPDAVVAHATMSRHEQQAMAGGDAECRKFTGSPFAVPLSEIRLILDTQITQDEHEETIISPAERDQLVEKLRQFINGADVYGQIIQLAEMPVGASDLPGGVILPPAVRVRDKEKGATLVAKPAEPTDAAVRQRARERAARLSEHGFLQSRTIKPLLAVPSDFGKARSNRMANDLHFIWRHQGIEFVFDCFCYRNAQELARWVDRQGYDAVLAVLPESWRVGSSPNDTHNQLKQHLTVPSQCIHHDNTLPASWVGRPHREFREADPRLARRIRQRYELCLGNLLVKHHWVPFVPAEPFNYNVHVGIDVGGRHNTTAMVCVGHGFSNPGGELVFAPEEIPIDVQKAEPIPTRCLLAGLQRTFQSLQADLSEAKAPVDFNRMLFLRDGPYLGAGDEWNEVDALAQLHADFLQRGWIDNAAVWTAIEVLKSAEGWRLMSAGAGGPDNPIVGRYVFPFEDERLALVCTTGRPYLPQGTACPLRIRIFDIAGTASRAEAIRDFVWEADMCFSKPDMGMRLPWVLHVADSGALQASRKFTISGIPA